MTQSSNPNGLTDEQITARPKPYAGMIAYFPQGHGHWNRFEWKMKSMPSWTLLEDREHIGEFDSYWSPLKEIVDTQFLLPGEPECPWPPPPRFNKEWNEGDRVWLLDDNKWMLCEVWEMEDEEGLTVGLRFIPDPYNYTDGYAIDTPALFVPKFNDTDGEAL